MSDSTAKEKIWHVVSLIPAGKVATYGQVAELAGLGRAARLVGQTLSKLPKDTHLPWFRVVNARGEISFSIDSPAYQRQKQLLDNENIVFINGKIRLKHYLWQP